MPAQAFVVFPVAGAGCASSPTTRAKNHDRSSGCGSEASGAAGERGTDLLQPPPPIVRLTPNAELASVYRARYFDRSVRADESAANVDDDGPARVQDGNVGGNGTRMRTDEAAYPEQAAKTMAEEDMQAVVVQEPALQRRVEAERIRMATKGCFVPLLRWLPGDKRNFTRKGKRRRPSSASPAMQTLTPNAEPKLAPESEAQTTQSDASDDGHRLTCGAIDDDEEVREAGEKGIPDVAEQNQGGHARGSSAQPLPAQEEATPPAASVSVSGRTGGLIPEGARRERSSGSCLEDARNAEKRLELEVGGKVEPHPRDMWPRHTQTEKEAGDPTHQSRQREESTKDARIPGEEPSVLLERANGLQVSRGDAQVSPKVDPTLDTFQSFNGGLRPPGTDAGSACEEETIVDEAKKGVTEGGARVSGCLDSTTRVVAHFDEATTRITGTAILESMDPAPNSFIQGGQDGSSNGDQEQKSEAPSACYDEDFEDDAEGYSLSDSDAEGEDTGATPRCDIARSRPNSGCSSSSDLHDRNTARQVDDTRLVGVERTTPSRGVETTVDGANILVAKGRESFEIEHVVEPQERPPEQQLADEKETAAVTAALQIQKWVRAWLRFRNRCDDEKAREERGYYSAEMGSKEWLDLWRARRYSEVKHSRSAKRRIDEPAARIQAAVRRMLALKEMKEQRRKVAKYQAAALKIQAFVRHRWRKQFELLVVKSEGDEPNQTAMIAEETAGLIHGEQTRIPSIHVMDSAATTAREASSAVVIQKAVRRSQSRKQVSSDIAGGVVDTSSSTLEADQRPATQVGPNLELLDHEGERRGSGEVPDRDDVAGHPSTPGEELPTPVVGGGERDTPAATEGDQEQREQRQQRRDGALDGSSPSTPPSPLLSPSFPSRPLPLDDGAATDFSGDDRKLESDTEAQMDTLADEMMTTVAGSRSGSGAFPSGSSAVGLSPVPERRPLVSVVASASEYGSDDLEFEAFSSSVGSSGSGSGGGGGSNSDCSFGSFGSGSSSMSQKTTKTNADSAVPADAGLAATATDGGTSADFVNVKETQETTKNQEVRGVDVVAVAAGATEKDLADRSSEGHASTTRGAPTVVEGDGNNRASSVEGDSDGSSFASLTVSSSSS